MRLLLVGRDPPCSCPASSTRRPGSPTPTTPCITRPLQKRSRTTLPRLGPLFPPPSPLRAPRGKPHRCPSIPPSERRFPCPNSGCIAAAVHPLGEPSTEPFPRQSQPHLTSLSPSPWCKARALSSATTVPAPPPSTATALCCPTAPPPTCRRLGEPRRQSSCRCTLPTAFVPSPPTLQHASH
jgi:hypothetical protein